MPNELEKRIELTSSNLPHLGHHMVLATGFSRASLQLGFFARSARVEDFITADIVERS